MQDEIDDVGFIIMYAEDIKRQLEKGERPRLSYLNRMAELAAKLQRTFDRDFAEFVEENR